MWKGVREETELEWGGQSGLRGRGWSWVKWRQKMCVGLGSAWNMVWDQHDLDSGIEWKLSWSWMELSGS